MNSKIYLATPAFDGKVNVQYAIAMAETTVLCAKNHINVQFRIVTSGSLLCAERNRLITDFINSDCTHMLCIDSDLGWPCEAVLGLLSKNVEFVAGCYPARGNLKTFIFRPIVDETQKLDVDKDKGLLKMEYIPAGFMLIQRSAIEKMIKKFPELYFEPKDKSHPPSYALFNTEVIDQQFWGEDYIFCKRAREAGVDIWVDPMIQFDHSGNIGMLAEVLTDVPPEKQV